MDRMVVLALSGADLAGFLDGLGEASYRADQILQWLYQKEAVTFEQMTNLPLSLRRKLADRAQTGLLTEVTRQESGDGTVKFLFALQDGQSVETVVLSYRNGFSVCVSTQVGCRMGCRFCASGQPGFVRNLEGWEMTAQVLQVKKWLLARGRKLGAMVLMGSGEPLDNLQAVTEFLAAVKDPSRLGMSLRNVTVSTSGLVPGILELARLRWPVTLSVSLHAPSDRLRDRIMPVNRKYPLNSLLSACRQFARAAGRRVTFEYILIDGLNDSRAQAVELASLLKGLHCHVNLIPLNAVPGLDWRPSGGEAVRRFAKELRDKNINVTVRRRLGADIAAACGQLRNLFQGSDPGGCRGHERQGTSKGKK